MVYQLVTTYKLAISHVQKEW